MSRTPPAADPIPVRSEKAVWVPMMILWPVLGAVFVLFGAGAFLGADGFGPPVARLVLGTGGVAVGGLVLAALRLPWRIVRARPSVTVSAEGLRIDHPGLFRWPLTLPRDRVTEVCVGAFLLPRRYHGSPPGTSRWRRLAAYSRWVDSFSGFAPVTPSTEILPDLSFPFGLGLRSNVVVVLCPPVALADLPHRGFWPISFAMEHWIYEGPVRSTVVNGVLFAVRDEERLRRTLSSAGWPVADRLSEEALKWVSPGELGRRIRRRRGRRDPM